MKHRLNFLKYEYFEGHWRDDIIELPNFDDLIKSGKVATRKGYLPSFDDGIKEGTRDRYAIRFSSNLVIPKTGFYHFDICFIAQVLVIHITYITMVM